MPPVYGPPRIETKPLSSAEDGYGYQSHARHPSGPAPRFPPGLVSTRGPFQQAEISNQDGFWNDSLAANSGNASIETAAGNLVSQTIQNTVEQRPRKTADSPDADPRENSWIKEQELLLHPRSPPDMEDLNKKAREWFDSGRGNLEVRVKNVFKRSEGIPTFESDVRYGETEHSAHIRTDSGSYHAPIGSERPNASIRTDVFPFINESWAGLSDEEARKQETIEIMATVLANLASYHGGENPGPSQRYSQPPAWCIDHGDAGRKSFFNDNWGDVPKRVGRDPRYQKTVHEGRTTYFEDPNSIIRRDYPFHKPTPGWGNSK